MQLFSLPLRAVHLSWSEISRSLAQSHGDGTSGLGAVVQDRIAHDDGIAA